MQRSPAVSICALNYYGESTSTSEYSTIKSCYSDSNACSAEPIGYAGGGRESDVGKKTTAELCGTIPSGFDSTIWSDGSKTAKVDENNARKHTVTYAEISCDASVISNARYKDGKVYFTFSDANTEQDIRKMALIECKIDSQNYQTITAKVYVTLSGLENQEAPSADKFDLVLKNNGSDITAEIKTALEGVEFSFEGVTWHPWSSTDARHDELIVGFIRYAKTDTHNASAPSFKKIMSGHGDLSANHYDRVEPSCVDDGNIEYWECTQCNKKFSDAEGLNEVKTVVLAALGHKLSAAVEENRVEATCVVDGSYDEVVYCSVCEEEFSRTHHTIPAPGHKWETKWSHDEHDHWHKCENCDEINDKAAHISSGAATETTPETCTVCRYVISPELGHIHANHLTEVPAKTPKVEFVIDSTRSWIVDGSKITSASAADFSILPGNADKSVLRGVIGADIKIKDTGVPADLKLSFRREFAGQFANVYKLTEGKLVFQNCVKVDENGIATVSGVNTNGEYVVMVCKFSDRSGDMNNDGILNALDASSVLKDIVGIADGENPLMGDYNGDGVVNALDAAAILKAIVGIAA